MDEVEFENLIKEIKRKFGEGFTKELRQMPEGEFAKAVIHRRTKEFRKRKWVTIDQNRNSQRIISILLSHHTLKLKINKTHYEAVHAPCL